MGWWDENVHRKGGERWIDNAERGDQGILVNNAEELTNITQQQVSRWRKWLRRSELAAIHEALAPAEKEAAKERKQTGRPPSGKFPDGQAATCSPRRRRRRGRKVAAVISTRCGRIVKPHHRA